MRHDSVIALSERFIIDYGNAQSLQQSAISDQPVVDLRNNHCSIFIIQTNNSFQLYSEPITINLTIDGNNMSVERVPLHAMKVGNGWQFSMIENQSSATYLTNILHYPERVHELKKLFASLFMSLAQLPPMKPIIFIIESETDQEFIEAQCVTLIQNPRFAPLLRDSTHVIICHDDDLRGYAFFQSLHNVPRNYMRFLLIEKANAATECVFKGGTFIYSTITNIPEDHAYDGITLLYGDKSTQSDQKLVFTNHTNLQVLALLGYIRWHLQGNVYDSFTEEMLEKHIHHLQQELTMWQSLKSRIATIITSLGQQ
jgi:hypothetical protein